MVKQTLCVQALNYLLLHHNNYFACDSQEVCRSLHRLIILNTIINSEHLMAYFKCALGVELYNFTTISTCYLPTITQSNTNYLWSQFLFNRAGTFHILCHLCFSEPISINFNELRNTNTLSMQPCFQSVHKL